MTVHLHVHGHDDTVTARLETIEAQLAAIQVTLLQLRGSMNDKFQEISAEVDTIKANVIATRDLTMQLKAQVADLQAQVQAGSGVSNDDLNLLDAKLDEVLALQTEGSTEPGPSSDPTPEPTPEPEV